MKKILLLIFTIISTIANGQEKKQIDSLNYAHIKIAIPENCHAKSEYELLDCNGFSIQWLYLTDKMLKTVPNQFIDKFSKQPNVKSKSKITLESFGSKLNGFKFKMINSDKIFYRIIVYGIVNNQPLLLNIGTDNDIKSNSDLTDFLRKIITVE